MSRRTSKSYRTLGFQQLEDRTLMAGNVTAAMSNHSLNITAQSTTGDLDVRITQVAANQFRVDSVSGLTTINGGDGQTFTVTGNISVVLKGGNDILRVGSLSASDYTTLPGSLNIVLGDGNNRLELHNASVGGNFTLTGGVGNDNVYITGSGFGRSTVNGGKNDANINLGNGFNLLDMEYTTVERDLILGDNSVVGDTFVLKGGNVGRNATISTGIANDVIAINEYYFGKALTIKTGAGNDQLVLGENWDLNSHKVVPGSMSSVHADSIFADLGAGDDTANLGSFVTPATIDGNIGSDKLIHDGAKTAMTASNFEFIDGVAQHAKKTIISAPVLSIGR